MAFRTSAEYLAALRMQRPVVYCGGERIADYKSPRKVRFLSALPRNPNGKVLKDEVRRLLNEG